MIQIEKEKWSPGSATRRKHLSKGSALRVSRKRRPIWTAGKSAGPTRASMARPNDRSRPCSPKKNRTCSPCLWSRSAITNTENASCIRSEEHTSELQSRLHLVCRLLLEKKKNQQE